ncbi:MAG: hypothetical protein RMJ98_07680, partial [Myxococcales bacterium]|nr:hypothetical protein [Polyangiaceae bacterium]MDW8249166.1 hypothetical protein [Myxococcales bacterium]
MHFSPRLPVPARLAAILLVVLPAVALAQGEQPPPSPTTPSPSAPSAPPSAPPSLPETRPTPVDDSARSGDTKNSGQAAAAPTPLEEKSVKSYEPIEHIRFSDFMDTRLTFVFGDDDVTKANGEVFPLSPTANFGDRPQYRLFFDNLNS